DNNLIASGGNNGELHVWDSHSGQKIQTYSGHKAAITGISWTSDGTSIASTSLDVDAPIGIWNARSGKEVASLPIYNDSQGRGMLATAWSPNKNVHLAVGIGNAVYVFDNPIHYRWDELDLKYMGHDDRVRDLSWSPDGQWLASASNDQTVRVWDAESGNL